MEQVNLTELIAAHRDYSEARNRAIEFARAQGVDDATVVKQQREAFLEYLRSRLRLLAEARARALERFDADAATYQQKIDEVQRLLQSGGGAGAVAAGAASPVPTGPAKPGPGKT